MNRDFDYARHLAKCADRKHDYTDKPGFRYQALNLAAKLLYRCAMHLHQRKAWEIWSQAPDKQAARIAELEAQLVSSHRTGFAKGVAALVDAVDIDEGMTPATIAKVFASEFGEPTAEPKTS